MLHNKEMILIIKLKFFSFKTIKIHKLIATHFLDTEDKKCIDHIDDNNRLNNNVNNLRYATYQENNRNAKIRKDNSSKIKGVYFDKKYDK